MKRQGIILFLIFCCSIVFAQDWKDYWKKAELSFNRNDKIDYWSKAIDLIPSGDKNLPIAYNLRGFEYFKLIKYDEAIQDYNKAIELDPDFSPAYCNRGRTFYTLEKYDEADRDFAKAIVLNSNYEYAYYFRGLNYIKLGKLDDGLKDLIRAKGLFEKAPINFKIELTDIDANLDLYTTSSEKKEFPYKFKDRAFPRLQLDLFPFNAESIGLLRYSENDRTVNCYGLELHSHIGKFGIDIAYFRSDISHEIGAVNYKINRGEFFKNTIKPQYMDDLNIGIEIMRIDKNKIDLSKHKKNNADRCLKHRIIENRNGNILDEQCSQKLSDLEAGQNKRALRSGIFIYNYYKNYLCGYIGYSKQEASQYRFIPLPRSMHKVLRANKYEHFYCDLMYSFLPDKENLIFANNDTVKLKYRKIGCRVGMEWKIKISIFRWFNVRLEMGSMPGIRHKGFYYKFGLRVPVARIR